ncbi:hypothetical protein [Escherichia coli]|uniref:hypothetical protein n=1 Tax=Escherichia coli TaxID=562 RepID=UPI001C40188E
MFPTSEAVKKGGFDNLGRITEMDNTALLSSLVTAMRVTFEQRNLPKKWATDSNLGVYTSHLTLRTCINKKLPLIMGVT